MTPKVITNLGLSKRDFFKLVICGAPRDMVLHFKYLEKPTFCDNNTGLFKSN